MKPQTSCHDSLKDTIAMPFNRIKQPYTSSLTLIDLKFGGARCPIFLAARQPSATTATQVLVSASRSFSSREPSPWRSLPSIGTSQDGDPGGNPWLILILTHLLCQFGASIILTQTITKHLVATNETTATS